VDIAIKTFFIKCLAGCDCLTESSAKQLGYLSKCSNHPCGQDLTQPPIDGYQKKYCYGQCPTGCQCLTSAEVKALSYKAEKCDPNEPPCTKIIQAPDLSLKSTINTSQTSVKVEGTTPIQTVNGYCYQIECPEGCDCLSKTQAAKTCTCCYTGTAWASTCICIQKACGVDGDGFPKYCCPKLPVVKCQVSPDYVPYGGGQVSISWTSQYADKVMLSINSATPYQVPPNNNINQIITEKTCFKFVAENKAGTSEWECCVHIGVTSPPPDFPKLPPVQPPPPPPPSDDGCLDDGT